MKKTFFIYLLGLFLLASCISIQGLTNDYGKLSEQQKALIAPLESFENLENGKIYSLTAKQLKSELNQHEKALVYVFTNNCVSKYCLPMNVYKGFAETNGYQLFLVMNGYANLNLTLDQMVEIPYFSIDNEAYGVSMRAKYTNYFENELMDLPKETKHKEYLGDLFFFENGELKEVKRELPKSDQKS